MKELYNKRREKYEQADVRVEVSPNDTPTIVAENAIQSILSFIENNPPLWQTWKNKQNAFGVEAAARMNPGATASAGVGYGDGPRGTITHVSMQDIQSGKVKLPFKPKNAEPADSQSTKGKGFQRPNPPEAA